MTEIKSDVEVIIPSDLGVTQEDVMKAIQILKKDKERKEKKENKTKNLAEVLQKKALRWINDNYRKFVIIDQGEGYYIIAHSQIIKIVIEHTLNIFQPHEVKKDKDVCTITIVEYSKINKEDYLIKKYINLGCDIIKIK